MEQTVVVRYKETNEKEKNGGSEVTNVVNCRVGKEEFERIFSRGNIRKSIRACMRRASGVYRGNVINISDGKIGTFAV